MGMKSFAHVINPVKVAAESDLSMAQPVTFETMRRARRYAEGLAKVDQYAVCFPEDAGMVPAEFTLLPYLTRSILDLGKFQCPRKLPMIGDILTRLHVAANAEYMIYTNVDIALMPGFYRAVSLLLDQGYDSLVINRRTIPSAFRGIEDLELMYAQAGEAHPGHDCFVWRREFYPAFELGNICIGSIGVGKAIILNQLATAARFEEFGGLHLTFHLGAERAWRRAEYEDISRFNLGELAALTNSFRARGRLPNHPLVARFTRNLGV